MTSGKFKSIPITSITIDRDARQRRELRGIDELAESIARIGLINPIVVDGDHKLVAGERRLTACTQLGWTSIPAHFTSDLSEYELQVIELEENVKRVDLTWQEECAAIERFHTLKRQEEPGWSQGDTAAALGYSAPAIGQKLSVAAELTNETIAKADKFSVARNIVSRNEERKKAVELASVDTFLAKDEEVPPALVVPLFNTNFHEWQQDYAGPKFNLIHCDFPYGINVAASPRMGSTIKDHYDDSPDIFWSLLDRLAAAMDNVVADSAHLIFWFHMGYYVQTKTALEEMGWKLDPYLLIWHKSDNSGTAPDPQRAPRRTHEVAFFGTRGDRKLTSAGTQANSFAHPGRRTDAIHVSEKPQPMLRHFLRMICDEYSIVLDPTCGSANALKVAEDLGAATVLGLEQDAQFHATAVANWSKRDEA